MSDHAQLTVAACADASTWDRTVNSMGGHPLQLWGWGELKSAHRWSAERVLVHSADGAVVAACQLLTRALPAPLGGFVYAPRGPVFTRRADDPSRVVTDPTAAAVADALADYVRSSRRAVAVSLEPDEPAGSLTFGAGWRAAHTPVLPARTLILDLTKGEDELLAEMTKKHRQYIRKSAREGGIEIRPVTTAAQLDACLEVYRATSARADFGLHEDSYYHDAMTMLGEHAAVWASYVDDEPVAFLFLAASARTAFELYGGMNETGQRLRANYALKWHAIRAMRERGVRRYDLGGLINDGVTAFKTGFASHEDRLAGTWDRPGPGYWLWNRGLPLAKKLVRAVGR